jgi:hypothetical protein
VRKQAEHKHRKKIPREKGRKAERNQRSTLPSSSSLHKKNQPKTGQEPKKTREQNRGAKGGKLNPDTKKTRETGSKKKNQQGRRKLGGDYKNKRPETEGTSRRTRRSWRRRQTRTRQTIKNPGEDRAG